MKQSSMIAKSILESIEQNMSKITATAEQVKLAQEAASKTYFETRAKNQAKKDAINQAMVELKSALQDMVQNENEQAEKTYRQTLIQLGLKSEDHPFAPIGRGADEAAKGVLNAFGKVVKGMEDVGTYIKDGVNNGRKS